MATHDDYVECAECGHPLERHTPSGCDIEGCICREGWTQQAIQTQRKAIGLPASFRSYDY